MNALLAMAPFAIGVVGGSRWAGRKVWLLLEPAPAVLGDEHAAYIRKLEHETGVGLPHERCGECGYRDSVGPARYRPPLAGDVVWVDLKGRSLAAAADQLLFDAVAADNARWLAQATDEIGRTR